MKLVLLHGYGADEHDLAPLAAELGFSRDDAVSLAAPLELPWGGRAWFNLSQGPHGFDFDPDEARAGMAHALAGIRERSLLLGFSQGASMALGIALTHPELVAGVLALSGVPPVVGADEVKDVSKLKIFAAHGTADPLIPVALGRMIKDEMQRLGAQVEWHEYPMGHMICGPEIEDAKAWLKTL